MDADIKTLFSCTSFNITSFVCRCNNCNVSATEYQKNFSICYVSSGGFLFKVFRNDLECHNGKFLINKPGFTHKVQHFHTQPDECFIIGFNEDSYKKLQDQYKASLNNFLTNADLHSLTINSSSEAEYLVHLIAVLLKQQSVAHLQVEGLVYELVDHIFSQRFGPAKDILTAKQKTAYLPKIELVKAYLQGNLEDNIDLEQLALISNLSPFHFNRIFRQMTHSSPYQYLLNFRLHHAAYLLRSTNKSIADIGYQAGFNSPEHFSFAFKAKYHIPPNLFRQQKTARILK
jgi:AraC-like DNA-binding protein